MTVCNSTFIIPDRLFFEKSGVTHTVSVVLADESTSTCVDVGMRQGITARQRKRRVLAHAR